MFILYPLFLSQVLYLPGFAMTEQQIINQFTDSMVAFKELGIVIGLLFVLVMVVVGFIVYQFLNYRLRVIFTKRDAAREQHEVTTEQSGQDMIKTLVAQFALMHSASTENSSAMVKIATAQLEANELTRSAINGHTTTIQTTAETIVQAVNKVNDAVEEIKGVLPTLATRSEMDTVVGRLNEAIDRLEQTRQACIDKKHATGETQAVTLPQPDIQPPTETDVLKAG